MLVGVALRPEPVIADRLVTFADKWADTIGAGGIVAWGAMHLTLYQFPIADPAKLSSSVRLELPSEEPVAILSAAAHHPDRYAFAYVNPLPWLVDLHLDVVGRYECHVDRQGLRPEAKLGHYTPTERASYAMWGYRFVGDAFRPHMTLGYACEGPLLGDCAAAFIDEFCGETVRFTELVEFRADEHGQFAEVLGRLAVWEPAAR